MVISDLKSLFRLKLFLESGPWNGFIKKTIFMIRMFMNVYERFINKKRYFLIHGASSFIVWRMVTDKGKRFIARLQGYIKSKLLW